MSRKIIATLTTAAALAITAMATAPAANAAKSCSGHSSFGTRGGYWVELSRYKSLAPSEHAGGEDQMSCSSVRYVIRFLRVKIRRQRRHPHISGPFYDGYVTWHCWKRSYYRWQCEEYASGTAFRFRGVVY